MARSKVHYYEPGHMTKTSHTRDCCDRPEAEHPAFPAGEEVTLLAKRDLTRTGIRKGQVFQAKRWVSDTLKQVRPSRWGTNELGQFAEIDRGEYEKVKVIGWVIQVEAGYGVVVPVNWAKEV